MLKIQGLRKRMKFVAQVSVPHGAGASDLKGNHIDFWFYKDYDPVTGVGETQSV